MKELPHPGAWPQEKLLLPPIRKKPIEYAKLRLALLKENFRYREFYDEIKKVEDEKRIKGPPAPDYQYHLIFEDVLEQFKKTSPTFCRYCEDIGFDLEQLNKFVLAGKLFLRETLDLLDPRKNFGGPFSSYPAKRASYLTETVLPSLFQGSPAVYELTLTGPIVRWSKEVPPGSPYRKIRPYERIYRVDLRKGKSQLLREFERYIKKEYETKRRLSKQGNDDVYCYGVWSVDNSRFREEAWQQLRVWKLRNERKPFTAIARELRMSHDKAKKAYYRAFELTQGKTCDRESLPKKIWAVKKEDIKRTCDTCPARSSCTELCPDALRYVDQDVRESSKEKLLQRDEDKYKDSLLQAADGARHISHKNTGAQIL